MSPEPSNTCFACGSPLRPDGARRAQCTNPECPIPGSRYLCEFCNQFSVTPQMEGLVCNNPQCRMSGALRKGCPQCRKISLISFQGMDQCLNRRCPSNVGRFTKCIFCSREAMYIRPEFGICIKAHCSHFLVPVNRCFFCAEMSYNREKMVCENPDCKMTGVRVELCPDCGTRAKVADPSHPQFGNCLDPRCAARKESAAPEAPDGDKQLAMSGTFMLGPDQMRELDRIIGSAERDEAAPPADVEKTLVEPQEEVRTQPPDLPRDELTGPGPAVAQEDLTAASPDAPSPSLGIDPNKPPGARPSSPAPDAPSMEETLGMSSAAMDQDPGVKAADGPGPVPSLGKTASEPQGASPEPAAPEAPPLPSRPGGDVQAEGSSLLQAFEFVKEYVLSDVTTGGGMAPVYLVIGTAGAGKTTYLTMLGEILRARETKYYFPYEGIDVRRIQVEELLARGKKAGKSVPEEAVGGIKKHVRDLVFDFAQKEYSSTVSRGHWPEQTPPDEESSCFLVTELTRYQKPVARIVTFETSGEDFEAALRGITAYDPTRTTDHRVHRMIYELMDMASGFVILMTPEGRESDEVYRDFFLAIRDGLEPQAMNVLSAEVLGKLQKSAPADRGGTGDAEVGRFTMMVQDVRRLEEMSKRKEEEFQRHRLAYTRRLRQLSLRLKKGELEILDGAEGQFLKEMEEMLKGLRGEQLAKVRKTLQDRGMTRENIGAYYAGLLDMAEKELDEIIRRRELQGEGAGAGEGGYSAEDIEHALWDVRRQYHVSDDFRIDPAALSQGLGVQREVRRFKWLRRISITFTKTDMYPSTYPPENHPERNLPDCNIYLKAIVNYLHLLGGKIRFYNASTSGYSILRDTLYVPGPENTLTPINIVEPIFDMLGIEQ